MVNVFLRELVAPFQGTVFPASHMLGCCWSRVGVTDRWSPCLPISGSASSKHVHTYAPAHSHVHTCEWTHVHMRLHTHVRAHTHVLQLCNQTVFSLPQQSCHIAGQHLPTRPLGVCEDRPAPSLGLGPPQALGKGARCQGPCRTLPRVGGEQVWIAGVPSQAREVQDQSAWTLARGPGGHREAVS